MSEMFPTDSIVKEQMLNLQEENIKNRIDNQLILNLLIEKELVSLDEIKTKRKYISNQTMYSNKLNEIKTERELNSRGLKMEQDRMKLFEVGFMHGLNK